MVGCTQRLVGQFTEVRSDEIWNNFMPEDLEAMQKRQQQEAEDVARVIEPYVPPPCFKVSVETSLAYATSKASSPATAGPPKAKPSRKSSSTYDDKSNQDEEWVAAEA